MSSNWLQLATKIDEAIYLSVFCFLLCTFVRIYSPLIAFRLSSTSLPRCQQPQFDIEIRPEQPYPFPALPLLSPL